MYIAASGPLPQIYLFHKYVSFEYYISGLLSSLIISNIYYMDATEILRFPRERNAHLFHCLTTHQTLSQSKISLSFHQ